MAKITASGRLGQERGETAEPKGQRIMSILLFEDLAIVPFLALVAFLAPAAPGDVTTTLTDRLMDVGIGIGAIAALLVAGLYLLNPLFRILADARRAR